MHPVFPGCGVIKKGPGGVSCPVLDRYAITDYVTKMDAMLPRMMEAAGVTEELKARDPMQWVGLMNTLKAQVEEIIENELIYI
ncbi:hypothetical protein B5F37_05740 [Drancourtella sp. An210]|nr:hypothetical protein B5F37_05740 [Drancourtella sp. An210]